MTEFTDKEVTVCRVTIFFYEQGIFFYEQGMINFDYSNFNIRVFVLVNVKLL